LSRLKHSGVFTVFIVISLGIYSQVNSSHNPQLASASTSDSHGEPVLSAYPSFDFVFTGRVQSIDPIDKFSQHVTFNITKVWKGENIKELLVNDSIGGCKYQLELSRNYLVYAGIMIQSPTPEDAKYYAIDKSGKIISTSHCNLVKTLEDAAFDILALDFLTGRNSTDFELTDSVNGYDYTLYGRHTGGMTVKELEIHPDYGLGFVVETNSYDADNLFGVLELSLPRQTIDGLKHYDLLIEDTSERKLFDMVMSNETHNVVTIGVPGGTHTIFINALAVAPEFSSSFIAVTSAVAAIVSLTAISRRYRIWGA